MELAKIETEGRVKAGMSEEEMHFSVCVMCELFLHGLIPTDV